MRLTQIKLAGFKSFVDPTTIPIPSNLVGIVGPNGCGKSNAIDAVRWVMGESSAKNLRGEAMSDVIFNGSLSRKPVGQAAVEMIFDNSEGRVGGQYSHYGEISVKRLVGRDGQSRYYLNGSKCRRRDITDLFSGTGLGPRSYSIIEQGMISRLIEARPEELRVFLEEAAGISKYKERRRETENRIRHTRENLERLDDLRNELARQIEHLQQQAKTAEQFKTLKEQQRYATGQLHMLHWRQLDGECATVEMRVTEAEAAIDQVVSTQQRVETDIATLHSTFHHKSEQINEIQARFYAYGAEIAGIEQSIQHSIARAEQRQTTRISQQRNEQALREHLESDRQKVEALQVSLIANEAQQLEQRALNDACVVTLTQAEEAMQSWQDEWALFNQRVHAPEKQLALAQVQRQQQATLIAQHNAQLQHLDEELATLDTDKLLQAVVVQTQQQAQQAKQFESIAAQRDSLQSQLQPQREANRKLAEQLDRQRSKIQQLNGQKASLEALQQAALGGEHAALTQWLVDAGLDNAQRLAQGLTVTPGWECAVECVLGFYLESICVDDLDSLVLDGGLENISLALFETTAVPVKNSLDNPRLLDQVQTEWSLHNLMGSVYIADDLAQALTQRHQLAAHESLITQEGIWLGASWLRVWRAPDQKAGVLQREQQLRELMVELQQLEQDRALTEAQYQKGQKALQALEAERESQQHEYNEAHHQLAEMGKQLNTLQLQLAQSQERTQQINQQRERVCEQLTAVTTAHEQADERCRDTQSSIEQLEHQREKLSATREPLQQALTEATAVQHSAQTTAHELALTVQSMRATKEALEQSIARSQDQLEQLAAQHRALDEERDQADELRELKASLDEQLALRSAVEKTLIAVRAEVAEIEVALADKNGERTKIERQLQKKRHNLETARLNAQALQGRRQMLLEKINETGYAFPQLFDKVTESVDEPFLQQRLATIEYEIQQLGPINLAAISEYETHAERQRYLNEQQQDLLDALTTLTSAIAKIDRETRARFKETFNEVNSGLQQSFPKLFGGGHASLELTGDDLLSAGVTVMASPPGKRNSTIHQLSGGEKALTAVALVFAIFELNPAPFCLLDEVDAPLDEANVERFCKMVESMSDRVQFIFITHNKTTMAMAQQLNGVTMSEPGVSRLVAVDIREAHELASPS
ncbi:Chromosome partition protein smc [hydrothermal vent metagenome]|uniref:Chromosome partition protein smc n=1 Tax=hydrothermal vent metagenome TaxID=652676 RepID=A0A3B0ZJN1_9ZZZZ